MSPRFKAGDRVIFRDSTDYFAGTRDVHGTVTLRRGRLYDVTPDTPICLSVGASATVREPRGTQVLLFEDEMSLEVKP